MPRKLKGFVLIICMAIEVLFVCSAAVYPVVASATIASDDEVPGIEDFNKGVTPANTDNVAANVLCDVIVFVQGRIGRAIALGAIVVMGIQFFLGKVTWTSIVILAVGLALLFGSKSIALVLLKRYIEVKDPNDATKVTMMSTEQAVREVCPEI